jgi:hypothetical protein
MKTVTSAVVFTSGEKSFYEALKELIRQKLS